MKQISGFTLVELMVTLAVAVILMTIAVPNFRSIVLNNRLSVHANEFVTAINLARSEAAKRAEDVEVVAIDDSDGTNEWGHGWTVQVVSDGTELLTAEAMENGTTLDSNNDLSSFTYSANGRVDNSDTLDLCDERTGETGRRLTISNTGRISVAQITC